MLGIGTLPNGARLPYPARIARAATHTSLSLSPPISRDVAEEAKKSSAYYNQFVLGKVKEGGHH